MYFVVSRFIVRRFVANTLVQRFTSQSNRDRAFALEKTFVVFARGFVVERFGDFALLFGCHWNNTVARNRDRAFARCRFVARGFVVERFGDFALLFGCHWNNTVARNRDRAFAHGKTFVGCRFVARGFVVERFEACATQWSQLFLFCLLEQVHNFYFLCLI